MFMLSSMYCCVFASRSIRVLQTVTRNTPRARNCDLDLSFCKVLALDIKTFDVNLVNIRSFDI